MTNPVAAQRAWSDTKGNTGVNLYVWCPGCDEVHGPCVSRHGDPGPVWEWNGDLEKVTISPSLLVYMDSRQGSKNCHSFIRDGKWEFLGDSHHHLAGKTVDMVPLPDWLVKE